MDYARNLDSEGQYVSQWKQSLFVIGSVISKTTTPTQKWFVLDVGQKGHSVDSGMPIPRDFTTCTFENGGDEHSKIIVTDPSIPLPTLGTRVFLIPGHCDPTVNMYSQFVAFRGQQVEGIHPIEAYGPGI